jgi:hypothetical protein
LTSIIDEMVPKLRRAIDDIEKEIYADTILSEYIEDAVDSVYLVWQHEYEVDRINHEISPDVSLPLQILFVMQSKLDLLNKRSDISFRTGSLSVTRKSDNKKKLSDKIDSIINELKVLDGVLSKTSEFDDYARRLEDWLYVEYL